jgi:hypothetical protein
MFICDPQLLYLLIYSLYVVHTLSGRCLGPLVTRPMSRGRGNLLRLLLERGLSRLQQGKLWVAVAVGERQPPEEEKGVVCQEEEDLALQHMLRIMGGQKGRPSP